MKARESGMPEDASWESFVNPRCILERLGCVGECGDVVEFGCGYGTFTIPAARLVGGRVFALDIEPTMIAETGAKAANAGLSNVVAAQRGFVAAGTGRPDASAGYVMLFNILHLEDPVGLLREAHRVLTPGGLAGLIHWRSDVPTPRGPSPAIRPRAEDCRAWGEAAGLEFVRDESLCCCSWHWGLVLRRPSTYIPVEAANAAPTAARGRPGRARRPDRAGDPAR
jgi:SAM-dependent methyltransferase